MRQRNTGVPAGAWLLVAILALLALPPAASADRTFALRYATNTSGDIVLAGNTITTCVDSAACTAARAGPGNNIDFPIRYVDVDTTDARPSSSRATLDLPAGSTVLFAGLYWGGYSGTGAGPAGLNAVALDTPGTATYQPVTASTLDRAGVAYQGFADVTSLVQAGGSGVYTLADVKIQFSGTNTNRYGGWSLAVVYRDGAAPPRNLAVYDGLTPARPGNPAATIALSGFQTPPAGPVNTRLGVVAYDGDRGPGASYVGDSLRLNTALVSDALNPATDFFNSTVSRLGAAVPGRDPGYANQLGYDSDLVDASGRLANGTTSATISLTTAGETYTPGVVTFATELYAPVISPGKTVVDVNGGDVEQGDVLEYRITAGNTGQDAAAQTRVNDAVPAGTTYVPGSLLQSTTSGAAPTARTDAAGDDTAEYVAADRAVTARLGAGATATAGGRIPPGASFELRFRVRVDADLVPTFQVVNQASLNFIGETTGRTYTGVNTPLVTSAVRSPDLALAKTHTGDPVRGALVGYTLTASNAGTGPARGTTVVTDTLPAGLDPAGAPSGAGWSCSIAGRVLTCTRSDVLAAGAAYPPINVPLRVTQTAPDRLINGASVDTPGDGNASNDAATDPLGASSNADLAVTKTPATQTAVVGQSVGFTLGVRNAGPTDATGVTLSDPLPEGLQPVTAPGCTIAGRVVTCAVGALAAGAQATRTLTATVTAAAAGRTLENSVVASAAQPDLNASDNTATATVIVGAEADVRIAKEIGPSPLVAGGPVRFVLSVTNDGPSPATAVVVEDPLPAGVDGATVSSDPAGAICGVTAGIARCTLDRLASGATVRVVITGTVAADAAPGRTLTNTATVAAAERDPDPADNSASAAATVTESADLQLTKTADPATVRAGERIAYTLGLRNDGPSVARAVTLTDALPAGLSPVAVPTGCTLAGRLLTCPLGDLAPGATSTIAVTADVGADVTGVLENTVRAESPTPDPGGAPSATVSTPVQAMADLQVAKRATPATIAAGEQATFTIDVRNAGPSTAAGARVEDLLPDGLEPVSATPAGCTLGGQSVACALGDLAPGATATVTVVARAQPGAPAGTLENVATASSAATDPAPADNRATAPLTIAPQADLEVTKRATPTVATAGERVSFSVELVNRGPSVARAVTLSDPLPAALSALTVDGQDCELAGAAVICTYGDLAPGALRTVTVSGLVPPGFDGTLTNVATATSATADPDPADDAGRVDVPVARVADLRIEKAIDPPVVTPGGPVTFTLSVENAGPGVADAVTVRDAVPAAVVVGAVSDPCTRTLQDVSCAFGALGPGETRTVTITGTVVPGFAGALQNQATVESPTADPVPGNNTDVAFSDANASADVSVTKSAPAQVRAGEPLTYTIDVANAGPSDAVDVDLRDPLPDGLTVTALDPGASCSSAGAVVACQLGVIPAGETRRVTVGALVDAAALPATLVNTATVLPDTPDPVPANDSDTATTAIVAETDVAVTKTASPDPATAGEPIQYTLRVSNAGPAVARAVTVDDPIPAGVAVTGVTPAPECGVAGGAVTCAFGDLAPRAEREIVVTGTVGDAVTGTLANTATVATATTDTDAGNDSASVATPVTARAALALTKTASPATATAGQPITYTLTLRNDGPSAAADVRLSDPVPGAIAVGDVTAPCEVTGQDVACAFGTLAAGATRTVTIPGTVDAGATEPLRNEATATSATPGTPPVTAAVATDVITAVALGLTKGVVPESAAAGEPVTFTLIARNDGPSRAVGARLTDTLPEGLSLLGVDPPGGCTTTLTALDCALGDLGPGDQRTLAVRALVAPGADAGARVNEATLGSPSAPDPVSATATVGVTRSADVRLRKEAPATATAGQPIGWTLTAVNDGPSAAGGVVITDTLPDGIAPTTLSPECTLAGAVVTCALGTLAPGEQRSVRIDALVAPDREAALVNSATVATDTPDPDPGDNAAETTTAVRARADLTVTKAAEPAAASAGAPLLYRITLSNAGPSAARDVVLDDPVPAGLEDVSATPADCAVEAGRVRCAFGTLAPGATREIVISGAVAPTRIAALENTVTVASPTPDDAPADNTATVTTAVDVAADLELTKVAEQPAAIAGTDAAWTLTVTNRGPATATGVTLHDDLPEAVTARSVTPSGTCVTGVGTIDCGIGDLAPGATRTVRIVGRVAPDAEGRIVNTAAITAATPDPDASDDARSVETPVTAIADVRIVKRDLSEDVVAGADLGYELRVVNDGPSVARAVVVNDRLPAQLTAPVTVSPPCTVSGSDITCELGTLAPGEEVLLPVTARVAPGVGPGTEIVNTATVGTATADPSDANNHDIETTNALARADLRVEKEGPAAVGAGEPISYTVTVTNDGPSDAVGVLLSDALPEALLEAAMTPAVTDAPACELIGRTFRCLVGDLANGASRTYTVTGRVDPDADAGTLVNRAEVGADTDDPDPADDADTVTATLASVADVAVTKSASVPSVTAGAPLTYTLVVANLGPGTARGVVLEDPLPAGVDLLATDDPGCSAALICALGALRPGETRTIVVSTQVAPGTRGTLTNTATVSADNDPGGGEATVDTPVGASADLVLAKTVTPDPLVPGGPAAYVLRVRNLGLSTADGVVLTDVLPPALTGATVVGDGGATCTLGALGALDCRLATLAPGAVLEVRVEGVVNPAATDPLTNAATVVSDTPEANPDDNDASVTAPVAPAADVALVKTVEPRAVAAGGTATFTLTARNDGPSTAAAVEITDVLPAALELGTLPAGCTLTGRSLSCPRGALGPGGDTSVSFTARVAPDFRGTLRNNAEATIVPPDPAPGDNTDTADLDVTGSADLQLEKTVDRANALAGETLTYSLTLTNDGPSTATDVRLADDAPTGLNFTGVDPATGCAVTDATLRCGLGDLAPGATRSFTLAARIDPGFTGTLTNTAAATSGTADPAPGNPDGSATVTVVAQAGLSLTKTAAPEPAVPGADFAYTLTARNAGPSTARAVAVRDAVPGALAIATVVPEAECAVAGQIISCDLGDLRPGEERRIVISGTLNPPATGQLRNTASATTTTPDRDPADDEAIRVTDLAPDADLSIDKTVSPGAVPVGGIATYDLAIRNEGPSTATGVTVDDVLDPALQLLSATSPQGTCDARVHCELGTLAPGDEAAVTIVVRPGAEAAGASIGNAARVGADTADTAGGNNVASAALEVQRTADLALEKTITPDPPVAGGGVTYTLTARNKGPSVATAVVLTDPLPESLGVTAVRVEAGAGDCEIEPPSTLRCRFGAVAVGASIRVAVDGELAPDATGALVNTASIGSNETDPEPGDNEATVRGGIGAPPPPPADLAIVKTGPAQAIAGGEAQWTLSVTNTGPGTATGVVVTDALPAGTALARAGASQGTCAADGAGLRCALGSLGPGASAQVTLAAGLGGLAAGTTIVNRAAVAAATPDPDPSDDRAEARTAIVAGSPAAADVRVEKRQLGRGTVGRPLRYAITVRNTGATDAAEVVVTDALPATVRFGTARPSQGACAGTRTVVCRLGALRAGASATVALTVTPLAAGRLRNLASLTAATPLGGVRDVVVVGLVRRAAGLRIDKRADRVRARPGAPIRYRLRVRNTAAVAARSVRLCDVLPARMTFVLAPGAQFRSGRACWTRARLRPGARWSVSLIARVDSDASGGVLRNRAGVRAQNLRPRRAAATTRIVGAPTLGGGVTG